MRRCFRHVRPWLLLALWLSPVMQQQADAAGLEPAVWESEGAIEGFDEDALFIIGNTLFTVYHELGHALIDLLKLPVIGREEDAVDGFAAVTMIPKAPDAVGDALIVAVADGWHAQSDLAADRGERLYWGEHALDEQRHFAIVCLMVGSDQEGFRDYAIEAGMPEERIESCTDDFTRMRSGWRRLLDPHRPDAGTGASPTGSPISITFDEPSPDQQKLPDLIREGRLLEDEVLRFGDGIALPAPVTIRFSACDDANAYWSESRREIQICYELIDEFDAILAGAALR